MKNKKSIERQTRGWLPKETSLAYALKTSKPRWRKPAWIAITLVAVFALAFAAYASVQTYLRYSNPRLDITASYYEKTLNCSTASIDDVVEVEVSAYWHGYVIPEFKRQVEIIDPYSESDFQLVGGNNSYIYNGQGGSSQFKYLLKVTGAEARPIELPNPRLYLDGFEIPLTGSSAFLEIQAVSESES